MGNLTQALEKLDGSIDRLQEAIDKKESEAPAAQENLFGELEQERETKQQIAAGLDKVIAELENVLGA